MTSYIANKINRAMPKAYAKQLVGTVSSFVGTREIVGEYDPVSGLTPRQTVTYKGRGIFGGFRSWERDQHILATDTKVFSILQIELKYLDGSLAEPKVDDTIDNLRVIDVQQDPAGATWSLQCRGTRIPAAPLSPYVLLVDENGIIWTDENGNPWIEER